MEAFDPQTNTWAAVAPMNVRRYYFSLISARGKLYAVGGKESSSTVLGTVEMYDPQQDRWDFVAPMPGVRVHHTVAATI